VVISLLAFAGLPASPSPEVSVAASPAPFAALAFDMFAGGDIWAANGGGIWRSDDGGQHWHDITPANLVGDDAAVRLSGFGSFGSQDLWFSANEAGDVARQGLRGFAVERSTDGGRSWHWTALPSCGGCNMSFSFLGPAPSLSSHLNGCQRTGVAADDHPHADIRDDRQEPWPSALFNQLAREHTAASA
jgi:hypothetical protein